MPRRKKMKLHGSTPVVLPNSSAELKSAEASSKAGRRRIKVPPKLQSVLWSTDVNLLDIEKDKGYIIHQVLIYGTLKEIKWLFRTYSKKEIIEVFVKRPSKIYPKEVFYFVKNFILSLKNINLSEEKYVTSISGSVRPRSAENLQTA